MTEPTITQADLRNSLWSALRFAASRAAVPEGHEEAILAAWDAREATVAELRAEVERKDAALMHVELLLADAARPSIVKIDQGEANEVRELGYRIGFGALMATASAQWRHYLEARDLEGGEFVCSPCRTTVANALTAVRAALSKETSHDD